MSLHRRGNGARVTAANLNTVTTAVVDPDPFVTVNEDLVVRGEFSGGSDATADSGDDKVQRSFKAGDKVRTSELTRLLSAASIDSVTPANGPAAGGTAVTIKGKGLDGVTAVTFGGTAATSVVVVDPRTVTCVTPAKAAGAYAVAVTDDGGPASKANGFTYA